MPCEDVIEDDAVGVTEDVEVGVVEGVEDKLEGSPSPPRSTSSVAWAMEVGGMPAAMAIA